MPSPASPKANKHAALVTGGAVRVGRAIALGLARAGFDVAIGYHRSGADARRTVRALEAEGVRALAVRADLADADAARRLVERAAMALGRLDVLVNNAAIFRRTAFLAVTPDTYDEFLDLNLRGAFFCAQAAVRVMGRGGGHIVNVGDAAVARPLPALLPYAMSKAGLTAFTSGLAAALAPRGIAVNAVAPGPVLRPPGYPLARWRRVTRDRVVELDDVAAAVVFLATCPPGITGQTVAVEGRAPTARMRLRGRRAR
jgi:NAD(P)-dependent dehydrogenase (short-subunit alcohol dehydrogenase family)